MNIPQTTQGLMSAVGALSSSPASSSAVPFELSSATPEMEPPVTAEDVAAPPSCAPILSNSSQASSLGAQLALSLERLSSAKIATSVEAEVALSAEAAAPPAQLVADEKLTAPSIKAEIDLQETQEGMADLAGSHPPDEPSTLIPPPVGPGQLNEQVSSVTMVFNPGAAKTGDPARSDEEEVDGGAATNGHSSAEVFESVPHPRLNPFVRAGMASTAEVTSQPKVEQDRPPQEVISEHVEHPTKALSSQVAVNGPELNAETGLGTGPQSGAELPEVRTSDLITAKAAQPNIPKVPASPASFDMPSGANPDIVQADAAPRAGAPSPTLSLRSDPNIPQVPASPASFHMPSGAIPAIVQADAAQRAGAPSPALSLRSDNVGHRLGFEIARKVVQGGDELTIRLDPVELGRISIKMKFDDHGSLRAIVSAESALVVEAIRRDAGELARTLSDAGVRTDSQTFRFDRNGMEGGNGGSAWQRFEQRHLPAKPTETIYADQAEVPAPSSGKLGRVDLLA